MMQNLQKRIRRVVVTIVGGSVLIVGIIAIPYPGPGWLIVFAGLGILSTEYVWARRVLSYTRAKYDRWQVWVKGQRLSMKLLIGAVTAIVVIVTIWVLNGYGILNAWLHLHQSWLKSPLPVFN